MEDRYVEKDSELFTNVVIELELYFFVEKWDSKRCSNGGGREL